MGSRIIAHYKVTYKANGIAQDKYLISREDYLALWLPLQAAIAHLDNAVEASLLKQSLKSMFGEWNKCFSVGGLLHDSISSGVLRLSQDQGGDYDVAWELVKS